MNQALAQTVVDLVGTPGNDQAAQLRRFGLRHWRQNHHWLITSGLSLHLLAELRKLGAESVLPDVYRERLSGLYDASGLRTRDLRNDLLDLNRRFQALGVPYVNWKGFALEPDFCPDIRLRNQDDFDFIIRPVDRELFHNALVTAGYSPFYVTETEWRYDLLPGQPYSLEDVYRPKPHRRVELHLGADSSHVTCRGMDLASLLQRRHHRTIEDVAFPVLTPEDAFVAHAAHAGKHALTGWVRISWLLELATFARHHVNDGALWNRVLSRIDATATIGVGLALALAERLWLNPFPAVLVRATEVLPPRLIRWLDENGRSFALSNFPGTKLHLFLHRELLDTPNFLRVERFTLYPVKVPQRVAYATAKAPLGQRARAVRHQLHFILRRVRFHVVENARYLLMKRRSQHTAAL